MVAEATPFFRPCFLVALVALATFLWGLAVYGYLLGPGGVHWIPPPPPPAPPMI